MLGAKALSRVVSPILNKAFPGGLILGYHQIAASSWDPLGMSIAPDCFRDQLQQLTRAYSVVGIEQLIDAAGSGLASSKGYAAVTFDDGYSSFSQHVLPVVEELGVPVTLFVTSEAVSTTFWWDSVVAALDPRSAGVDEFRLQVEGMGEIRGTSSLADATRLVRKLCGELERVDVGIRRQVVDQCYSRSLDVAQAVTKEQLRVLADHPLVEIGSHGLSHTRLDTLDVEEQERELTASRKQLRALTGGERIVGVSYPHGAVDSQVARLVEHVGYQYGCGSRGGLVRGRTPRYRLPRVWPPNVAGSEFTRWMSSWGGRS